MSVTSSRNVQVQFSGDISSWAIQSALDNLFSPGMEVNQVLVIGANTITAPVIPQLVVTGLTIIPPAGNLVPITLKGVTGDTGIKLHLTDPVSLSLDPTFVSLVLTVATQINGVRLIWS